MAIITQGDFAKRWTPGVKTWYGTYMELPVEYSEFMEPMTSDRKFEDIISMAGMGYAVVKPEGTAISYDNVKQGIASRFIPVMYATGYSISHEAMVDDQYNPSITQFAGKHMAFAMRQTKEVVCANILNNAAVTNGGDGVPLLSTAHPLAKGGTYSNTLATAADLSEATLETLLVQMMTAQDDAGLTIGVNPRKLIVGPNDAFNVERLLKSPKRVDTANNDISVIVQNASIPEGSRVNRFLTLTSGWFVMTDVQGGGSGLLLVNREGDKISSTDDFDTESSKFKVTSRFVPYWADARAVFGSVGA